MIVSSVDERFHQVLEKREGGSRVRRLSCLVVDDVVLVLGNEMEWGW